jgi:hypothetical protein
VYHHAALVTLDEPVTIRFTLVTARVAAADQRVLQRYGGDAGWQLQQLGLKGLPLEQHLRTLQRQFIRSSRKQ